MTVVCTQLNYRATTAGIRDHSEAVVLRDLIVHDFRCRCCRYPPKRQSENGMKTQTTKSKKRRRWKPFAKRWRKHCRTLYLRTHDISKPTLYTHRPELLDLVEDSTLPRLRFGKPSHSSVILENNQTTATKTHVYLGISRYFAILSDKPLRSITPASSKCIQWTVHVDLDDSVYIGVALPRNHPKEIHDCANDSVWCVNTRAGYHLYQNGIWSRFTMNQTGMLVTSVRFVLNFETGDLHVAINNEPLRFLTEIDRELCTQVHAYVCFSSRPLSATIEVAD